VRLTLKGKSKILLNIMIAAITIILLQSCTSTKGKMQNYVDNYLEVVRDLKSPIRVGIIKNGAEAIIAYRKSGFTDIDNAERAQNYLLEGIKLDSVSLIQIAKLKGPDRKAEDITNELYQGVSSSIYGNKIFAENYSKAPEQNIEERKETILNIRPGMRFLAEGLSSIVGSIENLQAYIKENNLKGSDEIFRLYNTFKTENDNIKGFLKLK
jgi:hypothetical protein